LLASWLLSDHLTSLSPDLRWGADWPQQGFPICIHHHRRFSAIHSPANIVTPNERDIQGRDLH